MRGKNASKRSLFASGNANAVMTLNSFEKGGDGGGPSECDGKYHSKQQPYCDASAQAMVVDECSGCDDDIVDASRAVWEALGVSKSDWGEADITWSDA
ncbi:putative ripening-related protein 1 [Bidens hawaiensis]|uniref:putative ripening-related protein 1 n=1 Tax=Bidens hawaiensis TaxID=980011 RepID=UPI0040495B2E